MTNFSVTSGGKDISFVSHQLSNGDFLIDIDQAKHAALKDLIVHDNKDGTVTIVKTLENVEMPDIPVSQTPAPAPSIPQAPSPAPLSALQSSTASSEASKKNTENLKQAKPFAVKQGNFFTRMLWTPEKEERQDLMKEIKYYNNQLVNNAAAGLQNNDGNLTGDVLKNIMLTRGAFKTEENPVIPISGIGTDDEKTTHRQCPAMPFCATNTPTADSLLRYSHWDQILNTIGLGKYAGKIAPADAQYTLGSSFNAFSKDLIALIRKDTDLDVEGKSDVEALKLAGLKPSLA